MTETTPQYPPRTLQPLQTNGHWLTDTVAALTLAGWRCLPAGYVKNRLQPLVPWKKDHGWYPPSHPIWSEPDVSMIAVQPPYDVVFLDADCYKEGAATWEDLQIATAGSLKNALFQKSIEKDSYHFVYRVPTDHNIKNCADSIPQLPHLDVRTNDGLIYVKPSKQLFVHNLNDVPLMPAQLLAMMPRNDSDKAYRGGNTSPLTYTGTGLCEYLQSMGYKYRGQDGGAQTFDHPGSSSQSAGVRVMLVDGAEKAWSFQGDALNNEHWNDLASCMSLLEPCDNNLALVALKESEGDWRQALQLMPDIERRKQQRAQRRQQSQEPPAHLQGIPDEVPTNVEPIQAGHPSNPFKNTDALSTLRQMGIGKQADQILSKLDSDFFVFEKMVIAGQTTIIAAPPNAGKTLLIMKFIIDAVSCGSVNPSRVFYLNCDDFPRGQAIKSKILEKWQVTMLAPGWNGFDVMQFYSMLNALVKQGQADGTILILDTLRRFVDTLSHDGVKEFGMFTRKFNSAGGTIAALAHTNKNKTVEGKRVLEGVQGIANDADAVYIGDVQTVEQGEKTDQTVTFEATPDVGGKVRGDNDRHVSYSFSRIKGEDYQTTLDTVKKVDQDDVEQQREHISVLESLRKNEPVFPVITSIIQSGICQMTQVINAAMGELDMPKHTVRNIIMTHMQQKTWQTYDQGYRWHARARDPKKPAAKLLTCLEAEKRGVDTLDNG